MAIGRGTGCVALALALVLLPAQALLAAEAASGALRREDIIRVDLIGRGRSVGRLLGVERGVLLLGITKDIERIPVGNVMRVWRDDGGTGKGGNTTLGAAVGAGAACLVALAVPAEGSGEYGRDSFSPRTGSAKRLLVGGVVGAAVFWAVSSFVSSGQRQWTELPVSELAGIDTRPVVEELTVDEEQLSAVKPADASDKAGSRDAAAPAVPQATPPDRRDASQGQ